MPSNQSCPQDTPHRSMAAREGIEVGRELVGVVDGLEEGPVLMQVPGVDVEHSMGLSEVLRLSAALPDPSSRQVFHYFDWCKLSRTRMPRTID